MKKLRKILAFTLSWIIPFNTFAASPSDSLNQLHLAMQQNYKAMALQMLNLANEVTTYNLDLNLLDSSIKHLSVNVLNKSNQQVVSIQELFSAILDASLAVTLDDSPISIKKNKLADAINELRKLRRKLTEQGITIINHSEFKSVNLCTQSQFEYHYAILDKITSSENNYSDIEIIPPIMGIGIAGGIGVGTDGSNSMDGSVYWSNMTQNQQIAISAVSTAAFIQAAGGMTALSTGVAASTLALASAASVAAGAIVALAFLAFDIRKQNKEMARIHSANQLVFNTLDQEDEVKKYYLQYCGWISRTQLEIEQILKDLREDEINTNDINNFIVHHQITLGEYNKEQTRKSLRVHFYKEIAEYEKLHQEIKERTDNLIKFTKPKTTDDSLNKNDDEKMINRNLEDYKLILQDMKNIEELATAKGNKSKKNNSRRRINLLSINDIEFLINELDFLKNTLKEGGIEFKGDNIIRVDIKITEEEALYHFVMMNLLTDGLQVIKARSDFLTTWDMQIDSINTAISNIELLLANYIQSDIKISDDDPFYLEIDMEGRISTFRREFNRLLLSLNISTNNEQTFYYHKLEKLLDQFYLHQNTPDEIEIWKEYKELLDSYS